jgi:hypothetical protein
VDVTLLTRQSVSLFLADHLQRADPTDRISGTWRIVGKHKHLTILLNKHHVLSQYFHRACTSHLCSTSPFLCSLIRCAARLHLQCHSSTLHPNARKYLLPLPRYPNQFKRLPSPITSRIHLKSVLPSLSHVPQLLFSTHYQRLHNPISRLRSPPDLPRPKDIAYPLDRLNGLLRRYERTGEQKYNRAVEALRQSVDLQPRNDEGGLWYYT